jgi:PPOX class probable F420-dependent enzyme
MGIQLDEAEINDFLAGAHTAIVATLRQDGSPFALPVWFVMIDGSPYIRTPARTAKAAHLRRDPRICLTVERGEAWAELKAVVMTGSVEFETDPELRARIDAAFSEKYRNHLMPSKTPDATRRAYATERVYLRIVEHEPTRSWDNAKIRLPSG